MKENKFTFSEIEYERPDFQEIVENAKKIEERIQAAESYDEVKTCLKDMEKMEGHMSTMTTIVHIRHTIDTRDEFYEKENEYINQKMPEVMPTLLAVSEAFMNSPYRENLQEEYGERMFVSMELQKKTFCEENIPLMQREAELTNEYQKIMAAAEIPFRGETKNLYGIQKFFEDEDRETRAEAFRAYTEFYHKNEERLEQIWDELISIRNEMGRNLGYENFIPVGYMQQGRTDYSMEEVAAFRRQVREKAVPLCTKLYELQKERLGVDEFMAYDEKMVYPDGNAVPAGDEEFMVSQAQKMYHDISPETGAFIDFMIEHELMDLENKPGKASTGYMTILSDYRAPFVFSCFNHTTYDMQVMTHEMGHAFAGYMAMNSQPISEYYMMSTDIAEIHSMSMEQFAYKYAEQFFGEQAEKYRFSHLQEAVTFVPFGAAVDEFQHICYANPKLSPKERTLEWKKLEEIYMPWRKYEADDFFDRGGYWYHKLHIFLYPFYYINYVLTTMGALEFAEKNEKDHETAWEDYLNLCKCGGSKSYLEALKHANLSVPFEEGSVKRAMDYAERALKV